MYRNYSDRIQSINEAIRNILTEGKYKMYDPDTRTVVDSDAPGANRVFGEGDKAYIMRGGDKVYLNRPSYNKPLIDVPAATPAPSQPKAPSTSGRETGIGPSKTAVQPKETWDEVTVRMYPDLAGAELKRVNGRIFADGTEVPGASLKTSHYAPDAPKRSDVQVAGERARPTAEPIIPGLKGQPPEGPSRSTEYPDMESKRVAGADILAGQRGDTRPASERQPGGGPAMISPEEVKRVNPEHPSQLPPEQLGAKTGEEPRDIEARRSQLKSLRQLFDLSILQGGFRHEGQPPSFTPEGESPKPGRRADGTQVDTGTDAQGNPISTGGLMSRAGQVNPEVPYFSLDAYSLALGALNPLNWLGKTNYNKLERKNRVVPQNQRSKFEMESMLPESVKISTDPSDRIQRINETLSLFFEKRETYAERLQRQLQLNVENEKLKNTMREIRDKQKAAELEKRDQMWERRFGKDAEGMVIAKLRKWGMDDTMLSELPSEHGKARTRALRDLYFSLSQKNSAASTANFHNTELGRAAANELLRQQGKDPLPDTATGKDVLDIFNQSRAQAKADKAAYTASQRPKTPAERAAWLADYKEGERQHRLDKIRAFDPSAANSLERAYRADRRFNSAQQQWGDISAELDRRMDDYEDAQSQKRIDKFRQGMQREPDPTRAELEAQVRGMNLPGLSQEMTPDQKDRLDSWIAGGSQGQGSTSRPSTSSGQSGRQSTPSSGQSQGGFEYYNRQTGKVERSSSPGVDRVFRDSSGKAYRIEGGSGRKVYV